MREKLKMLKSSLIDWYTEHIRNIDGRLKDAKDGLKALDIKGGEDGLSKSGRDEICLFILSQMLSMSILNKGSC